MLLLLLHIPEPVSVLGPRWERRQSVSSCSWPCQLSMIFVIYISENLTFIQGRSQTNVLRHYWRQEIILSRQLEKILNTFYLVYTKDNIVRISQQVIKNLFFTNVKTEIKLLSYSSKLTFILAFSNLIFDLSRFLNSL